MKEQSSVQGKLGFSCGALLNPQVLLSLTVLLHWSWQEKEVAAALGGRRTKS